MHSVREVKTVHRMARHALSSDAFDYIEYQVEQLVYAICYADSIWWCPLVGVEPVSLLPGRPVTLASCRQAQVIA